MEKITFSFIENFMITFAVCYWIYWCIAKKEPGKFKIKTNLAGKPIKGINGIEDIVVSSEGKIVPGNNKGSYEWIWRPFQKIDKYEFGWVEGIAVAEIGKYPNATVLRGGAVTDGKLTIQRKERTVYHLSQHDYRFWITNLETGEPKPTQQNATHPENIKVGCLLNGTIVMENIYDARFRAGGKANWYFSVEAVIISTLGEIIGDRTYKAINEIRGEKIQDVQVKNTEPMKDSLILDGEGVPELNPDGTKKRYQPIFVDNDGNRLETVTFIQRVNYEILVIRKLGVKAINIALLDYEMDAESKAFGKALNDNAIATVGVDTADKIGQAIAKKMAPKIKMMKDLISHATNRLIKVKKTRDVTKTQVSKNQNQLRVNVNAGSNDEFVKPIDVKDLVNFFLSDQISQEISDEGQGAAGQQQQQNTNRQNRKQKNKGGNQ